jgi:hypothetical protein
VTMMIQGICDTLPSIFGECGDSHIASEGL